MPFKTPYEVYSTAEASSLAAKTVNKIRRLQHKLGFGN